MTLRPLAPRLERLAASALVALCASAVVVQAQDAAPAVVTKITADLGYVQTSGNTQVTTMNLGEKFTQQRNFPSTRAAGVWRHAFTQAAYFQQNVEFVPNLKETEDWRVNSESSVVAPLSARIGLKLAYVVRFDNLPEPGFTDTDKLFTTGIQITF